MDDFKPKSSDRCEDCLEISAFNFQLLKKSAVSNDAQYISLMLPLHVSTG